ncbi:hypothetical protein IW140_001705 [Coemansia sp. RSA 1813]|nr:hypothetical protein LPJ74_001419 [Coemansia sp. RSA 1843]KAJ2214011.1 hypothetical protein EV179_003366 [Coemansia sp. RSA 487]KAJ2571251.1 hypothetical protein IW140_001705 [Coemansia sp. RSA 1813]
MTTSNQRGYVRLPLRLKTKDSFLGRLKNIQFIVSCVADGAFNYYWKGPEIGSQGLRYQIIKTILQRYLAESLPHNTPNDLSEKIDFEFMTKYITMNNLPSRPLTSKTGYNREFDISIDPGIVVDYDLKRYGLSGEKLDALVKADKESAARGKPRTISCQIVLGINSSCMKDLAEDLDTTESPALLSPHPLHPNESVILYFHGGAYCVGERSLTHLYVYANVSTATGLRVFSPNYRLAPKSCFPCQLHDCFLAYSTLLKLGYMPENIVLAGDSAGGALSASLLLILREMDIPCPAAAILLSPWVDSACSGKSWVTNQGLDYLPPLSFEDPFHPTRLFYAAGRRFDDTMLKEFKCPLVSPIYGDLRDMPPMLIQVGGNELLKDDVCAFAEKVQKQNANCPDLVKLEMYPDMPHAFTLLHFTQASQGAFASMGKFVKTLFLQK